MYFKLVAKDYHDPWYWCSLAHAINNNFKLSETAMKRSVELSDVDINKDPAFKKLKRMIKEINRGKYEL